MYHNQKVVVVLPAYNTASKLESTYLEIPFDIADELVLVDDNRQDNTIEIAKRISIKHIIWHEKNSG